MNGIIIINKEKNMTSRDVVNKLCKIFNTKKIGHTGTLDPIAEGCLICCIGSCTKLCDIITCETKEYIATIKLGIRTDTLDITGKVLEQKPFSIDETTIKDIFKNNIGNIEQTVPLYSAIKINGKKLYEYARANQEIELPKRNITIYELELIEFKNDEITFRTVVSKGTYIRSLIEDLCYQLGTIGTMKSLIRTKQGKYSIKDSYRIDDIINDNYKLISKEEFLNELETIDIDNDMYLKIKNGSIIPKTFSNDICCFKYNNKIIAIYKEYEKDKSYAKPYKMFLEEI